ncbi:MAG: Mor transcription activator family protein [Bilifractor sp.]
MSGDPNRYSEIYRELASLIGESAVTKIWKNFAGITVTFPKRLYSSEYTRQYIRQNMGKEKASDIARKLNLSERRVRQIMKEIREEDIHQEEQ